MLHVPADIDVLPYFYRYQYGRILILSADVSFTISIYCATITHILGADHQDWLVVVLVLLITGCSQVL
jgi:hypothetical protein